MKDDIIKAYLYTALWAETDENEEPLDYNYDASDFSEEAVKQAQDDLVSFFCRVGDLINGHDKTTVVHDFWLTRNGHGAGFWDGDYENGDELTEISQRFKEISPYVGDDGRIYFI